MPTGRNPAAIDVDQLVASCDPVDRAALSGAGIDGALDAIAASISSVPSRARAVRRHRKPLVVVLVAAVVAISAGVAIGAVLSAHTGRYVPPAEQPMGGPGEELNPAAPDFRTVALQIAADIPYPGGYESWRDLAVADASDPDGLVSTGALHGWFAASAFCAWVQDWRQQRAAGDRAAAAHAAQEIAAALRWKAVTDEDPHPSSAVPGDLGSTYSLFGWMLPYREAVLDGDTDRVVQLLASGYGDKCWTSDPAWRAQLAGHRDWGTLSRAELAQKYERYLTSRHA